MHPQVNPAKADGKNNYTKQNKNETFEPPVFNFQGNDIYKHPVKNKAHKCMATGKT